MNPGDSVARPPAGPPGVLSIWMLVALELFTFAASAKGAPGLFHESRKLLAPRFGHVFMDLRQAHLAFAGFVGFILTLFLSLS